MIARALGRGEKVKGLEVPIGNTKESWECKAFVITMHGARCVLDGQWVSLRKLYKCLITILYTGN